MLPDSTPVPFADYKHARRSRGYGPLSARTALGIARAERRPLTLDWQDNRRTSYPGAAFDTALPGGVPVRVVVTTTHDDYDAADSDCYGSFDAEPTDAGSVDRWRLACGGEPEGYGRRCHGIDARERYWNPARGDGYRDHVKQLRAAGYARHDAHAMARALLLARCDEAAGERFAYLLTVKVRHATTDTALASACLGGIEFLGNTTRGEVLAYLDDAARGAVAEALQDAARTLGTLCRCAG